MFDFVTLYEYKTPMKTIILFLFVFSTVACAQENVHQTSVQLFFGRSFHGTGDVFGIEYGGSYAAHLSKRTFWFAEVGGSIHDGVFPVYYTRSSGEVIDASIYYTTAGLQASVGAGVALLQRNRHALQARVGVMGRYQSSSYWDRVEVIYPPLTGLDFPVAHFINTTPKKTMSLGGRGSLSYSYTFKSALFVSLNGSLQTDSNGDTLTSTFLGFGKRL